MSDGGASRKWRLMLGPLFVWAGHFFALYAIGSIFPGTATARWLTGVATLAAIGADLVMLRSAVRIVGTKSNDDLDRWAAQVCVPGALLSLLAVAFQGLAALF